MRVIALLEAKMGMRSVGTQQQSNGRITKSPVRTYVAALPTTDNHQYKEDLPNA
jgi:hypothetical protein